jgi:hypothetical protein
MAHKLWEKNFEVNKEIERFTVGRDRELDLYLAKYDESFDFLVYFKVLFPKFMCHNFFIFNPGKESSPVHLQSSRCLPAMASSPYP